VGREGVRGEFTPGKGVGYLADGTRIVAKSTICATGVEYRRLNLPNKDRLLGAGAPPVPNTCTSARLRTLVPLSCTRTYRPEPFTVMVVEGPGGVV